MDGHGKSSKIKLLIVITRAWATDGDEALNDQTSI